jgi:hypothetical protein
MLIREIIVEALEPGQRVAVPGSIKMPLSARAKQLAKDKRFSEEDLKYFSLIEKVCSDFVKVMKSSNYFLYRGMKNSSMDGAINVIYGKSFENRIPLDTDTSDQKRVDELLSAGGIKALRSNSIFTSGNPAFVEKFGPAYLIFPRNGFHYTWSKHRDWIPDMSDFPSDYRSDDISEVTYLTIFNRLDDLIYYLGMFTNRFYKLIKGSKNKKDFETKIKNKEVEKTVLTNVKKLIAVTRKYKKLLRTTMTEHKESQYHGIDPKIGQVILPLFPEIEQFEKTIPGLELITDGGHYNGNNLNKIKELIKSADKPMPKEKKEAYSKKFILTHKIKGDEGLSQALKGEKEILISGEYLAFYADDYEELLSIYFNMHGAK